MSVAHRHLALLFRVRQVIIDGVTATNGHPFMERNAHYGGGCVVELSKKWALKRLGLAYFQVSEF